MCVSHPDRSPVNAAAIMKNLILGSQIDQLKRKGTL
jgi:hypothetical protein